MRCFKVSVSHRGFAMKLQQAETERKRKKREKKEKKEAEKAAKKKAKEEEKARKKAEKAAAKKKAKEEKAKKKAEKAAEKERKKEEKAAKKKAKEEEKERKKQEKKNKKKNKKKKRRGLFFQQFLARDDMPELLEALNEGGVDFLDREEQEPHAFISLAEETERQVSQEVSYMCIPSGSGSINGKKYEAHLTGKSVSNKWYVEKEKS